jgi:hypothetical protein
VAFARIALLPLDREEAHRNAILALFREREAARWDFARKKIVRDLNQNTRAVTCFGVTATGAAMGKVYEDLQALQHDIVRGFALDVYDKAKSTRVMLIARVV